MTGPVPPAGDFPPARRAWGVVLVLAIVTTFAFIDRQLIYLLIDPMRNSLGVTDSELSLIQGLSFVLFYTLMGVPLGRLADRHSRRNLIIVGVVVWSIMTIACGLAQDFWSLFAARAGVGVGEAVLGPAAYSMLSDYFPPSKRGRPIGIIGMCSGLGAGGSFLIGGAVLKAIPAGEHVTLPLVGALEAWQMAFVVAGAPGFLICLLVLLIVEPARRELATRDYKQAKSWPLLKAHFKGHWFALFSVFGTGALLALVAYAMSSWTAAYLIRHYGLPPARIGVLVGISLIVSAIVQGPISGLVGDMLAKRGAGARIWVMPIFILAALPFAVVWPFVTVPMLALLLISIANVMGNISLLTTPTLIQELAPNEVRGVLLAGNTVFQGVVGAGLGPSSVALVSDFVFHNEKMLGSAMATIVIPSYILALILSFAGARGFIAARRRMLEVTQGATVVA